MDSLDFQRALATERELGALGERIRATERGQEDLRAADAGMRLALERGLADLSTTMRSENAHTRGEISRLDTLLTENRRADERVALERKSEAEERNKRMIEALEKQAAEAKAQLIEFQAAAKKASDRNRPYFAIIVAVGLFLQWMLENWGGITHAWELLR